MASACAAGRSASRRELAPTHRTWAAEGGDRVGAQLAPHERPPDGGSCSDAPDAHVGLRARPTRRTALRVSVSFVAKRLRVSSWSFVPWITLGGLL